jgi:hypothetical protein
MNRTHITAIAIAFACIATSARAEKAARGLADLTTIQDGEGHGRILFNWTSPIDSEDFVIQRAILRFDLAGEVDTRSLRLVAHPISKTWDPATVTWTRGWSNPGGDFDIERVAYGEIDLKRGSGPAYLDVTNIARETFKAGRTNQGLLVTVQPEDGIGIESEDLPRLAGLANASLEVTWRRTPPRPKEFSRQ